MAIFSKVHSQFDKRYTIVAAAFVIQAVVIGSVFAYSVFFKVLETELGWSRTLLSGCVSLSFVVMGALAVVGGRLNDRFGPRWVLSVSGACFGLGYALMYYMSAPWQLVALYGGLIGIGLSTHDVVTLSTIARWFKHRRGMMTSVVKIGTACGQIVIPLVAAALIAAFGWRLASLLLGCGAGVILVLAAQGLRHKPRPKLSPATPATAPAPGTHNDWSLSLAGALRTRQLRILCAAQFMFFPSLVTIPLHIVAHGIDLGMTTTRAVSVLSLIAGSSILGRLFIGAAVDRIGGRRALLVCFAVLLLSLLWLRFAEAAWMLFIFAVLYGFAHGGLFTVVSPAVAEFFGMRAHGAIFGVIVFCGTIGGALGPLLAGSIFDATGSYNIAFTALAVLALIGLLLVLSLRPIATPAPDKAPVSAL